MLRSAAAQEPGLEPTFSPDRIKEADAVDECVRRLTVGELDPSGDRVVGYRTVLTAPGLANWFTHKKRRQLDAQQIEGMRKGITEALAAGWLMGCRPDQQVRLEREPKDLWEFWLGFVTTQGRLEQLGVPDHYAEAVRRAAANRLVQRLKEVKLARWLGGSKLHQIGMHYGQWGFTLRGTQTDDVPDETFSDTEARRVAWAERTPFDADWSL